MKQITNLEPLILIENSCGKKRGCQLIVLPQGSTHEHFQKELEKALKELKEESNLDYQKAL